MSDPAKPDKVMQEGFLTLFLVSEKVKENQDRLKCTPGTAARKVKRWVENVLNMASGTDEFDMGACGVLLLDFVPIVVGQRTFNKMKRLKLCRKIVTPSDEALAIIMLENSHERWTDMIKDPEKKKEDTWSSVKCSGEGKGGSAKKNSGWSIEGQKRFNDLNDKFVKEIRKLEDCGAFEMNFMRHCQDEHAEKKNSKKKTKEKVWKNFANLRTSNPAGDDLDDCSDEEDDGVIMSNVTGTTLDSSSRSGEAPTDASLHESIRNPLGAAINQEAL